MTKLSERTLTDKNILVLSFSRSVLRSSAWWIHNHLKTVAERKETSNITIESFYVDPEKDYESYKAVFVHISGLESNRNMELGVIQDLRNQETVGLIFVLSQISVQGLQTKCLNAGANAYFEMRMSRRLVEAQYKALHSAHGILRVPMNHYKL